MEVPPTSKGSHLSRESQFEGDDQEHEVLESGSIPEGSHSEALLGDQRAVELRQPDGKWERAIQIVSWVGQAVTENLSFQQWVHTFRQGRLHGFQDC